VKTEAKAVVEYLSLLHIQDNQLSHFLSERACIFINRCLYIRNLCLSKRCAVTKMQIKGQELLWKFLRLVLFNEFE